MEIENEYLSDMVRNEQKLFRLDVFITNSDFIPSGTVIPFLPFDIVFIAGTKRQRYQNDSRL